MIQPPLSNEQLANVERARRLHRKPSGKPIVALWDPQAVRWLREHQANGALFVRCGAPLVLDGIRYLHTTREMLVTVRKTQQVRWPMEDGSVRLEGRVSKHRCALTPNDFQGRPIIAVIRAARTDIVQARLIYEGKTVLETEWDETREFWELPFISEKMRLLYNASVI